MVDGERVFRVIDMRKDSSLELQAQFRASDEAESVETIEHPPPSPRQIPHNPSRQSPKPLHPLSLHVLALLVPFSILGTLARLGLQALGTYEGSSIFALAYAQAVGCLIMGLSLKLKDSFGRL